VANDQSADAAGEAILKGLILKASFREGQDVESVKLKRRISAAFILKHVE
jgi:hypothetical protein